MMIQSKARSLVGLASLSVMALFMFNATVQAAPPAQGLTLSPAVVTIGVSQTESEKSATITIKNNYSVPVVLTASLRGVDQDNGVIAPASELDENLRTIISLNKVEFALAPNESSSVTVTVKNSSKLHPGGTYAALVIKQIGTANNNVGIYPAIGAGIFITKEEGAVRALDVSEFSYQRKLLGEPSSATIIFKNTGNVQVVPRGQVLVTSQNLKTFYSKGIVNQESFTLLPAKYIKLTTPLIKVNSGLLPSQQKIIIQYRYDGTDQVQTIVRSLWHVPHIFIIVLALLPIGAVLVFRQRIRRHTGSEQQPREQPPQLKKRIIVQDKTDGEKIPVNRG